MSTELAITVLAIGALVVIAFFAVAVAAMVSQLGWRVTAAVWAVVVAVTGCATAVALALAELLPQ